MDKIDQVIYDMMVTNTGADLCDSGNAYGRNHEENRKKNLEYFQSQPEATLEITRYQGKVSTMGVVNIFPFLVKTLELDDICEEFNAMEVNDYDSENGYGLSKTGEDWLMDRDFVIEPVINSYNDEDMFSQVLQVQEVVQLCTEDIYVLLQIHGGCDVRGGYTDAKLFKIVVHNNDFYRWIGAGRIASFTVDFDNDKNQMILDGSIIRLDHACLEIQDGYSIYTTIPGTDVDMYEGVHKAVLDQLKVTDDNVVILKGWTDTE